MLQCEKEHGASKNARCSSVAYHRFFAICLLAVILESPYSRVHGLDTPTTYMFIYCVWFQTHINLRQLGPCHQI